MENNLLYMFLSQIKSVVVTFIFSFVGIPLVLAVGSLPGNISNLQTEGLDEKVKLSWEAAEDPDGTIQDYTIYYGNNHVGEENTNTYEESVTVNGNKTTFEIDNLINGVKYFFAMTATDNEGNESPYYSDEAEAIPNSIQSNSLIVLSAEHIEATKIEIKMSGEIKVDNKYDAFRIENEGNGIKVPIIDTIVNSKVITLVVGSGTMTTGDVYKVTATLGVSDLNGTPIASGITDTVKFTAKDTFPQNNIPNNTDLENEPNNNDNVTDIDAGGNTEDDFWENFLDDTIDTNDKPKVTQDDTTIIDLPEENTSDSFSETKETISNDNNSFIDQDNTQIPSIEDKDVPEEVQNIKVDKRSASKKGTVKISWEPSVSDDILNQVLYLRIGLKDWDKGTTLDKLDSSYILKVKSNENYQVRLVSVDVAGNKSYGQEFTFSTSLISTGVSIFYSFLAVFILLIVFSFSFKKSV